MDPPWKGMRPALGLLEIGRPWGVAPSLVPGEAGARAFLEFAFASGVRVYDTAPSYALSERRFGDFLRSLSPRERAGVFVAAKFGETWDSVRQAPSADHSYDGLMRSLDRSLELLGRIDLLQVHKSVPAVLRSSGVRRAAQAARAAGVAMIGASVKDIESASIACADPLYAQIQFPLNRLNQTMLPALKMARESGRLVFTNRPFAEGALLRNGATAGECIEFVAGFGFDGAVLFGTSSALHLSSNLECLRLKSREGAPPSA